MLTVRLSSGHAHGALLECYLMWESSAHCGQYHPEAGGPGMDRTGS